MKLNKKGWGFRMMFFLMGTLIFFLLLAIYLIYNYYNNIVKLDSYPTYKYEVEIR